MAIVELRVEQEEAREHIERALGRAFAEDPLRSWFVPETARRHEILPWFEGTVVRYCQRYGRVWVDDALRGVACWLPPGETEVSVARAVRTGAAAYPLRLGVRGLRRVLRYERIAEDLHAEAVPEPHWYLYLLGVDPPAQGLGLAHELLRPGLDRADVDGRPCYLETQAPGNVAIYERFGFAVTSRRDVAPGVVTVGMRREPRPR